MIHRHIPISSSSGAAGDAAEPSKDGSLIVA